MPRKVYTEQFKRDAVAMFESNPDTSMRKVAEELGINRSRAIDSEFFCDLAH